MIIYWRLLAIWQLLTKKHCIVLAFDGKEMVKLLTDEEYEMTVHYVSLRPYIANSILKSAGNALDADTLILQKAEFEAGVEMYNAKESFNFFKETSQP